MKKTGFTLLEVLLAAVIFAVSVAGVFATLNSVRAPVINKENQLAEVIYSKQVLENLYSQVNYATYYNTTCIAGCADIFDLELGKHTIDQATAEANGLPPVPFTANTCNGGAAAPGFSYTVSCADGSSTPSPCCTGAPLTQCLCGGAGACSANITHQVILNIQWWNPQTEVCQT